MGKIVVTHTEAGWGLPYQIWLNDHLIGILKQKQAIINLPAGKYKLGIRIGGYIPYGKKSKILNLTLSSVQNVIVEEDIITQVEYQSRERIWNILFDIDMLAWIASFFICLPHPWHIVYELVSNLFFVIWLIRLYLIRKEYFKIVVKKSSEPNDRTHIKL